MRWAALACLDLLELGESVGRRAPLDPLDTRETGAPLDLVVNLDLPVPRDPRGLRASTGIGASGARGAPLENLVAPDLLELLALWESQGPLELMAALEPRELWAP